MLSILLDIYSVWLYTSRLLLWGINRWIDDSRFLLPVWRWSIEDWEVSSGALPHRNIKSEDRTDYVYENTGSIDKMADNVPGFLPENVRILRKWTTINELFGRKRTVYAKTRDEGGFRIGSLAHGFIAPSAEQRAGLRWPDDPMIQWSDDPIVASLAMC